MERFSKDLKEHATKIINYEKRNTIPLTYDRNKSYKKQKVCNICKKGFSTDDNNGIAFNEKSIIKSEIIILENIEDMLVIFVI